MAEKILDHLPNNNTKNAKCDCLGGGAEEGRSQRLPDWFEEIRWVTFEFGGLFW